jgi:ribosomal protein S6
LNKYEGLFILQSAATSKEEQVKEAVEKVQNIIEQAGGRVATVQKMGQRPFAREGGKQGMGFYVNYIFLAPPAAIAELDARFHLDPDVFRWQFTRAQPPRREAKRKPRQKSAETVGTQS